MISRLFNINRFFLTLERVKEDESVVFFTWLFDQELEPCIWFIDESAPYPLQVMNLRTKVYDFVGQNITSHLEFKDILEANLGPQIFVFVLGLSHQSHPKSQPILFPEHPVATQIFYIFIDYSYFKFDGQVSFNKRSLFFNN